MKRSARSIFMVPVALLVACGGDGGGGGTDGGNTGGLDAGPPSSCEDFGRWPAPQTMFTLPAGKPTISYTDVQKSFPMVDWATLDRLYIPAGEYKTFELGNLPVRDKARPLVITNQGGQVKVGPNLGGNFIWSMHGGANWVLTGRYDPDAQTGDEAFAGHRCGAYAGSRGKYGFLSDDGFDTSGPYLHMGIAADDVTAIEIEYVEIANTGFAGIRLLNPHEAGKLKEMNDVSIHDTYIHDTLGEGIYFGWTGEPPSSLMKGLQFYNNRVVRTGNEALQIQDVGDGSHVYNNVFAQGGLAWLDNGLGKYQDHNAQISTREGSILIERNVFLRGPSQVISFWTQPQDGDGARQVTFRDNYIADASTGMLAYVGGQAAAGSSFTFERNFLRDIAFDYTQADAAATASATLFGISNDIAVPVALTGNHWEGTSKLANGITGGDGTTMRVTASGNQNGPVAELAFQASGYPSGTPWRALRLWSEKATIQPSMPTIMYAVGDLVLHHGELYEALVANSAQVPADHPASWKKLPLPTDDLRTTDGAYTSFGVR